MLYQLSLVSKFGLNLFRNDINFCFFKKCQFGNTATKSCDLRPQTTPQTKALEAAYQATMSPSFKSLASVVKTVISDKKITDLEKKQIILPLPITFGCNR